jgi:type IV pilus assembly protein PilY1
MLALAALAGNAAAGTTDIAQLPLATSAGATVLPNVMFILDDSGSMAWTHMPDSVRDWTTKVGYKNHLCNTIYYNPAITYTPPVDATGASYPNASFTAAKYDGFDAASATVDLSTSFKAYDNTTSWGAGDDTPQPAYYYKQTGTDQKCTLASSADYPHTASGSPSSKYRYEKVRVSSTSGPGGTDERQNFANWYSYYRTRMLMMKTAAGKAFKPVDNRYRVGFMTINTSSVSTGAEFLDIGTFDAAQKAAWYSTFYAVQPNGGTPLRAALSKAGRIYAGKIGTDPVQYSCQQNFAILSTDGFWNGAAGYREDGSTAIGNQDNNISTAPRPFFDGGSSTNASDTLADVAMYYYKTDLRPAMENNVPASGDDSAAHQHMTTFTLGLGASGKMVFSPTYKTDTTGDYVKIKNGDTGCSWLTGGATCNWPVPGSDKVENIDDLWHAAVNGRGTYFSATNPTDLATGLSNALAGVNARIGSSAAATTSNPNVTSGDNFVFSSTFTSVEWSGEFIRQQMDPTTGALSSTIDWHAQAQLDAMVSTASDTRTIYTYTTDISNFPTRLKPFTWTGSGSTYRVDTNLTAAEQAYFGAAHIATLSQWPALNDTQKALAAGKNLVNFLRGQTGYEDQASTAAADRLYRDRTHTLGDIVSAEAVYVKKPQFSYTDAGYDTFKTANQSRQGMVYVAANDGMLHAFNADTGQEVWAYIPSMVLPDLFKLADKQYSNLHRYFVDGTPVAGDAFIGGAWKTILVGGLNAGGRGYYALDITDPANPKALWEFKVRDPSVTACAATPAEAVGQTDDCDLGLSFGNPVITKKKDGTWVVLVTSGYNNIGPGDGKGYLYVLNAATGAIIDKIGTGQGSTGTPSGLAKISAWADDPMRDNTSLQVYGGDLLGNLWRFDIHGGENGLDVGAPGKDAHNLAIFRGGGGGTQPVTTKPELGQVGTHVMVFVGTGRYLGTTDLSDTSNQSFYGIKDPLDTTSYGIVRTAANIVQQTLTTTTDLSGAVIRTSSSNAVDLNTQIGWYIDLPDSGERSNTDSSLALGTLVFTTNVPNSSACTIGGYSWLYFLDYRSGAPVSTAISGKVARRIGNALATRPVLVRLPNNSVVSVTKLYDSTLDVGSIPIGAGGAAVRRVSWRELINE